MSSFLNTSSPAGYESLFFFFLPNSCVDLWTTCPLYPTPEQAKDQLWALDSSFEFRILEINSDTYWLSALIIFLRLSSWCSI